jgi:hypothetical protein
MPASARVHVPLLLDPQTEPARLKQQLEAQGLHLLHRLGPDLAVAVAVGPALPQALATRLPVGVRLLPTGTPPSALSPSTALLLQAWQHRGSQAYLQSQARRPHPGRPWGSEQLPALHADEDEHEQDGGGPASPTLATRAGPSARLANDRLINDVAVVLVIVDGHGSRDIGEAEKTALLADVQQGLDWLGGFEPAARVSWHYVVKQATVDITPWQGARWPGLPDRFYAGTGAGFDAAFVREDNGKLYVFRGDQYVRYASVADGPDAGYPKSIAQGWPGLPAAFQDGIDAGFARESDGRVYFFKGAQYVRFSDVAQGVDPGYPRNIADDWPGLPADFAAGVDAVLQRKDNHKIYFFKGDQYVRFSNVAQGVDAGYPKAIADGWPGLPESFQQGIDAALWRPSNGKIYLFKSSRWGGSYVRISDVDQGVDEGYPLPIGLSTDEAEALWRDPAMAQLGYAAGQAGLDQLLDDACQQTGAPRAVCAFITKQPTTWFAYAKKGRIVIRGSQFDNSQLDIIMAHETAHKFGAKDEYPSSNCNCTSQGGFFKRPNGNCANCNDSPQDCVMRNNAYAMCDDTPWHVGWGAFLQQIDAAVWRHDNGKAYLFSNDQYVRFSDVAQGVDEGYPRSIASGFAGLPAAFRAGIDAALWRPDNGKLYFFKGSQYVRFSDVGAGMDPGYPKSIDGHWKGLPASFSERIDAAVWREDNNKIYLFRGGQYVRFSDVDAGMDPGYPKSIEGHWPGLPASFQSGIDAALMRLDNHKLYFFKGRRYVRFSDVDAGVDPGYPADINGRWLPFPA